MAEKLVRSDGRGRQKCQKCELKSVAGLAKGNGLCPYHFTVVVHGQKWADTIYV